MKTVDDLLDYSDPELIAALTRYLHLRSWKQADLARITGINASTISDWMKGRYEPGGEALRQICEALEVSRSVFWATGERIVEERRLELETKRRAENLERLARGEDARIYAEAILDLDPEVRDEVITILTPRFGSRPRRRAKKAKA